MKIFSERMVAPNGVICFALYVDSEKTGIREQDAAYSAIDFSLLGDDPNQILSHLIPMLSELIYMLYGETPDPYGKKEPITKHSQTGFDPKYPNGVNTGIYDK